MIGLIQPYTQYIGEFYNNTQNSAGTAGALTAWQQMIAATADDYDGLIMRTSWHGNSSSYNLYEIGIGPSGSELVLIPGILHYYYWASSRGEQRNWTFNVRVPKGSRLAIRRRSSIANTAGYIQVSGFKNGHGVGVGIESYGDTTTSPFGTAVNKVAGNVFGAWTQMGITTKRLRQLILNLAAQGSQEWFAWEIGVGAAGSEQTIIRSWEAGTMTGAGDPSPASWGPFAVDIPIGTRIAVRWASQNNATQPYFNVQGVF